MADFVTSEVRQALNESVNDEIRLALIVGPNEESVKARAEKFGVEIAEELPSGVLIVVSPIETTSEFIDTEAIKSVSMPDRMETLS